MLNIALFGAPGAGKGTQSEKLIKKYKLAYIATGDLLREELAEGTKLGLKVKDVMASGKLVTDEIIVELIEKKIKLSSETNGVLFDGFPRNNVQAYILEGLLMKFNTTLSCMLSLEVPEKELIRRLLKRGKTSNRSDDNMHVIKNRLAEYQNKTLPVANFYDEKGIYYPINGVGKIEQIFNRLTDSVELSLKKELFNVVLFGYPGSGRGTQGKLLANKFGLVYISTGRLFREEIEGNTEIGKKIKPFVDKGQIAPDEFAIKLIEAKIKDNPNTKGFLFKGFPRTIVQAYILEGLLRKLNSSVSCMVDISVPLLESVKRLSSRGKTRKRRPYDTDIKFIIHRLEEYQVKTDLVAEYYRKQNKVYTIDGMGTEKEIFSKIYKTTDLVYHKAR